MIEITRKKSLFDSPIKIIYTILIVLLFTWLILLGLSYFGAETLWFKELNYFEVFLTRFNTKIILGLGTFLSSILFIFSNLIYAEKSKNLQKLYYENGNKKYIPQSSPVKIRVLLFCVILFSFLISVSLIFYTETVNGAWQVSINLPNLSTSVESPFKLNQLASLVGNISETTWQIFLVFFVAFLLILKTRFSLYLLTVIFSFSFTFISSSYWYKFLLFFNSVSFDKSDPLLNIDYSFYIFNLPLLQLIDFWLQGLFIYSILGCLLIYLTANNSLSEGKFNGLCRQQLRHIYFLASGILFTLAGVHWLNRYGLLLSKRGVVTGAGYADVRISLPLETIASYMVIFLALWLFVKGVTGAGKNNKGKKIWSFSVLPFLVYLAFYGSGLLLVELVQNTIVQPNELSLEESYLIRNIEATKSAFNLDQIEVQTFNPEGNLTAEDLEKNNLTVDNIRLWDTKPILQANRQLQQIRPYYVFPDGDIDRYNIYNENEELRYKQVIVAPRELDTDFMPLPAKTWVNEHLIYTHGYGFTMSPVNRVVEGGLPFYFINDIGSERDPGELNTSSPLIKETIPFVRPRIYFGELTDNYVMTNTRVPEFDFPSGEENFNTVHKGLGGINIGDFAKKLIFSVYLRDWRMLLTDNFTEDTRIFFRRNINERIKAIAPFLHYDRDPYIVVADGREGDYNHLYWLVDGYTISNYYPYSDGGENHFNYIRNSVKVVVDAYNGTTKFYISDENDPLIRAWGEIFPDLFLPLEEMPVDIRQHIRYPIDLFNTQSERLLTYHVENPQVFYNREDQWQVPQEIYGDEPLSIDPYYLIMKLPTETQEEFILLQPYTPVSRSNLIAWLAARCDGDNYGKLLLYQFPKQRLIFGPDQVEALINQDPIISEQISLWNRQGSKAIQGNLLVIPIEQSLLYVEPVYLEADQNSIPALTRVIVVYENQIVMANTLRGALDSIFAPDQVNEPTIIRPLQELGIP
ncbi:MAG: UPF0182 family protein [Cyanobacterium sp. T60_A2020_053]|nr:UPF0182 family protein [Cyanobacterium sp. T60_A2020_053]